MLRVDVKADIKAALRELNRVQREQVPKAAARALNTTATQAQGAAVKELAAETGLKQKDVRAAMHRTRATWRNLVAAVVATGRAVNLIRFTRQTRDAARKGAGVRANAWGKSRVYRGTFIGNQGRTVFVREGEARLPIKAVHGPSIPREMAREKVLKHLDQTIRTRWPINFARELKYYLSRGS